MPTDTGEQLYNHPQYYDVIFAADWRAEYDFLLACTGRYGRKNTQSYFEPACGTGRLVYRLAREGYRVAGLDLNPHAVEYCNRRLARHGLPQSAIVGDMCDFRLPQKVDAAFNLINSFRHLPNEQAAVAHLRCMAQAVKSGGVYLLGLHLTPRGKQECVEERWQARRGKLLVKSRLWTAGIDLKQRQEDVRVQLDVWSGARRLKVEDRMLFRTYNYRQMASLLAKIPEFELIETFDFGHDINEPILVDEDSEDVIYVLKRK